MKKGIFESKKSFNFVILIKYIIFLALMFVMWKAGIKNTIFPFAVGLFVALCWCNQNVLIMSAIFVLTGYLANFSTNMLFVNLFASIVIISAFFFHKIAKKPIKVWLLAIYLVLSQVLSVYFNISPYQVLLNSLISILISAIFMLACIKIFKTLLVRGVGLKLTIDEIICLCFVLLSVSVGLSNITIAHIELAKIYAMFVILLSCYLFSGTESIVIATVLGLGEALATNNIMVCGGYAIISLCALTFRTSHAYFSILAGLLAEVVLGLYFNIYGSYTIFSFLPILIGAGLFALLNKNTISVLKILFGSDRNTQASRNVINRSRNELCKKMYEISNIFEDMNKTFRNTVRGVLPPNEAKQMLTQEVMQSVCKDCPERFKCLRNLEEETTKVFAEIVASGLERGKATILDIPPFLSTRCNKINIILQTINQLLISYKQYSNMVSSMDTSKILIADQLEGVSRLLSSLATDTQKQVTFDTAKENQIMEELNYHNILASEVMLFENDTDTLSVTMVVRESDKDDLNIVKVLNKICKCKMLLCSSTISNTPNFFVNTYKTAPKYDLVYGSSGCPKFGNKVSGDSFSFIKLTQDKVLVAICDGMGAGENAHKTSDTAISLIENFYKAGFDSEIILNSVNRFLSMNSEENYSALDLCVVDLKNSSADFIKVGAPEGVVKHTDEVEVLTAGALPLGILEEMTPTIHKKLLVSSDMIILLSDGVIDNFGKFENLQKFVGMIDTTNPQEMSNIILEEMLSRCNKRPTDDCTVICARVFDRV